MSSVELCRMGTHELGLDGSLGHQRSVGHVLPASTYRIYSVKEKELSIYYTPFDVMPIIDIVWQI